MTLDEIFIKGGTYKEFASPEEKPVGELLLREIYDIAKMGLTSGNSCPLRIKFVSSQEEKAKLIDCAMEGNHSAIKSAPITAIFAYDLKFYEKMDILYPQGIELRNLFANNQLMCEDTAICNSTLQAAYFMIVARGRGLVLGPMSGFNKEKLDQSFFWIFSKYKIQFYM